MITPAAEAAARLGTAGRPCLSSEAKVMRADGSDAPDDEVGELLIRGPLVFQGYWNNEAETRAAIVDRKKDSIITGGLNVYPAEVESALLELDGVLECAAYGVPDEKWGEAVAASVVLAPGSATTPARSGPPCAPASLAGRPRLGRCQREPWYQSAR